MSPFAAFESPVIKVKNLRPAFWAREDKNVVKLS
jgi:hypothetical protein